MVRRITSLVVAIATGIACSLPVAGVAQSGTDMTAEEITDAFKKQKTRGLVLVPTTNQDTENEATSVAPAPSAAATPAPSAALAYTAVEREDQVNIQISFDFDSATLRNDQKPKLETLCQVMKAVDVSVFQIIGHTDSSGSAAYNERLSLLRAQEVKRHLITDCGIAANRLEAVGLGESALYDNANPGGDVNRRVEFQALG